MKQTVSVALPSSVLYVSGTVNDTAVTWTNTAGNTWEANADRSPDDIYRVALTAIDAAGNASDTSLILYYGVLHLITDRTQADVDRVRYLAGKGWANMTDAEKAEWNAGLKGAYNASDLNRVGSAVEYVAGRFREYGYFTPVQPKKDWSMADIPTEAQMARYLADVETLRGAVAVLADTPVTPGRMNKLNWQEANNIEQILRDVDFLLTQMAAAWFYCGDLYSGEV